MTESMGPSGRLTQIWIYPIKSCRRVALDTVEVVATGLAGDRTWQVVDADGNAVTQRTDKDLALVHVTPTDSDGLELRLLNPGDAAGTNSNADCSPPAVLSPSAAALSPPAVIVPSLANAENSVTVRALIGDEVRCADAGDLAAEFFSDLLGRPARLVGYTNTTRRPSSLFRGRNVTFVDAAPLLVANTASVTDLEARAGTSFGVERFRPNLVVDTDTAWVEDTWDRFDIGSVQLQVRVPWPRCAVPQIDQDTAERSREPAMVLRYHRWCNDASATFPTSPGVAGLLENNALFAVACSASNPGQHIAVGDPLTVHSTKTPVLAPPGALTLPNP